MGSSFTHLSQFASFEGWRGIEESLDAIVRDSQLCSTDREFYTSLVQRTVPLFSAVAGAAWRCACDEASFLGAVNWPPPAEETLAGEAHAVSLLGHLPDGSVRSFTIRNGKIAASPHDGHLFAVRVERSDRSHILLEFLCDDETPLAIRRNRIRLIEVVSDLIRDHEQRQAIARAEVCERYRRAQEAFDLQLHAILDPDELALTIANDGRVLLECDRLSVIRFRGKRAQVVAISGIDSLDPRSKIVRRMQALSEVAVGICEPIWGLSHDAAVPDSIQAVWESLVDASPSRSQALIPLGFARSSNDELSADERGSVGEQRSWTPLGMLYLERDHAEDWSELRERALHLARHASLALRTATAVSRTPFSRFFIRMPERSGGWWNSLVVRFGFWLAVTCCIVASLVFIPADFTIEARGELQPAIRRDLFAPADGIVRELDVGQDRRAQRDQVLIRLSSAQLEFETIRLAGELQTAHRQLTSLQAERIAAATNSAAREQLNHLTADEERTREQIRGIEAQREVLRAEQAKLNVTSPIDGEVLTWKPDQLLENRPVQRGQLLLTVADTSGPWNLELRVEDRHAGYVRQARSDGVSSDRSALPVRFMLASDTAKKFHATMRESNAWAEADDADQAVWRMSAVVADGQAIELRPGASVVARIHCGRRAIGFVWFHDLVDAVRRFLFV